MNRLLQSIGCALSLAACGMPQEGVPQDAGGAQPGRPVAVTAVTEVTAVAPEQPFHFDHRIHAGQYKIPCLTCHTGADHAPAAGIPTADKCMGCHRFVAKDKPNVQALTNAVEAGEPIVWNRVNRVPDHVFFNHDRHVRAGVACQKCHGPVETMALVQPIPNLTMGWCVQCHKANHAPHTDCLVCHK